MQDLKTTKSLKYHITYHNFNKSLNYIVRDMSGNFSTEILLKNDQIQKMKRLKKG